MSATANTKAITPPEISARKGKAPLVCLTAYTTPTARLVDHHCDVVLVGDSVGMVLHGLPSTLGVTLDMMIMHSKAVRQGLERALMVVDMPFGSYEASPEQAFRSAARIMAETGSAAVKLEGGEAMAETIRFLSGRGVPVMAHVGLTLDAARSAIAAAGYARIEYLELRAEEDLAPMETLDRPGRLLVAAWLGETRLIDNVRVGLRQSAIRAFKPATAAA